MSVYWCGFEYRTIQINGQRFIGPPEELEEPTYEWELFVKHIPRYLFEQELLPLFSSVGLVYQIRLLMCFSGLNRGIAFVRYTNGEDFRRAVAKFDKLSLGSKTVLFACKSLNLRKLVLLNIDGAIPDEIIREFLRVHCSGECVFIGFRSSIPTKKFAIIQFRCHYETALTRRKLMSLMFYLGEDCCLKWYNRGLKAGWRA
ncbi:RNA-binding protein 47-like [Uranotaenia lowii]|uniref:RNA-binding protein 47-like n=1 Tax=Uranotaenia lowii TaxID=190385 RepID=UPI0024798264|nr:RNA-binding protein 47-like [Uranotaenia lowii]XP_055589417.1 RNA-binding protein 47-like [Uranotaenia lowii]